MSPFLVKALTEGRLADAERALLKHRPGQQRGADGGDESAVEPAARLVIDLVRRQGWGHAVVDHQAGAAGGDQAAHHPLVDEAVADGAGLHDLKAEGPLLDELLAVTHRSGLHEQRVTIPPRAQLQPRADLDLLCPWTLGGLYTQPHRAPQPRATEAARDQHSDDQRRSEGAHQYSCSNLAPR